MVPPAIRRSCVDGRNPLQDALHRIVGAKALYLMDDRDWDACMPVLHRAQLSTWGQTRQEIPHLKDGLNFSRVCMQMEKPGALQGE